MEDQQSAEEGGKDTKLSGSAEQQGGRTSNQRTEVCHCTDAHKDQRRINIEFNAVVEVIEQSAVLHDVCVRQVCQQHTKCNRNQQQRLKLLCDAHVQQDKRDENHCQAFPAIKTIAE